MAWVRAASRAPSERVAEPPHEGCAIYSGGIARHAHASHPHSSAPSPSYSPLQIPLPNSSSNVLICPGVLGATPSGHGEADESCKLRRRRISGNDFWPGPARAARLWANVVRNSRKRSNKCRSQTPGTQEVFDECPAPDQQLSVQLAALANLAMRNDPPDVRTLQAKKSPNITESPKLSARRRPWGRRRASNRVPTGNGVASSHGVPSGRRKPWRRRSRSPCDQSRL